MDCIERYFPGLSAAQKEQMAALYGLYADWNSKINVIFKKGYRKPVRTACLTFFGNQ